MQTRTVKGMLYLHIPLWQDPSKSEDLHSSGVFLCRVRIQWFGGGRHPEPFNAVEGFLVC